MKWLRTFTSRLIGFSRKQRIERDLDSEVQSHLDMLIAENIRRGMTPEAARHAAKREFGGVEQTKEEYREQRGLPLLDGWFQDFRVCHPHVGQATRAYFRCGAHARDWDGRQHGDLHGGALRSSAKFAVSQGGSAGDCLVDPRH